VNKSAILFIHFLKAFILIVNFSTSRLINTKNFIFVTLFKNINTENNMAEKTRYTDSELEEFKVLIQEKLKEAQENYSLLIGSLSHNDDHGTDDTGRTFNMMEDGSETLSREEVAQLAARQEKFIQNLQAALVRIENKTYGICRVNGTLIPKERLRLVPHATMSIDAKNLQK
jgi:RNA polymerase-binding transcription factor DksA